MTKRDLIQILVNEPGDLDREVRVVYHGWESMSFNLPASHGYDGPNFDFLLIVEEPRKDLT